MLRHAVYFETLDKIRDENDPEWRSVLAGLIVLRLVDDWITMGPHVVTTDVTGLRAVRETVEAVSEGQPTRSILSGIIDSIVQAESADMAVVAPQLLAYGTTLVYDNRWVLAVDVFSLVLEHTRYIATQNTLSLEAALRIASAYRNAGEFDRAADGYALLKELASAANDDVHRLTADIGFAMISGAKGNLPAADAMLETVIQTSQELQIKNTLAVALHSRSMVCLQRGDYDTGIRYAYNSLRLADDARNKDRLLCHIACLFVLRGSWQVAQEAFLLLLATAQEPRVQWEAAVNLVEIATLAGSREAFEHYRLDLQHIKLPPVLDVELSIMLAKGHAQFGQDAEAREVLHHGISVAEANGLNQLLFTAEQLLSTIGDLDMQPTQSISVPFDISDVATAITDLREFTHAGV